MKTTLFRLALCLLFLSSQTVYGQYSGAKDGISYKLIGAQEGFEFSDDDILDFDEYNYGVEVAYYRSLTNNFGIDVPLRLGTADIARDNGTTGENTGFTSLGVLGKLQLFNSNTQFVVPSIRAGIEGEYRLREDEFVAGIPVGLGLDFRLAHHLYLNTSADYRFGLEDDEKRMTLGAGLKILLGDGTAKPKDRDKDGVADDVDQCPEEAGVAALQGCPDRDGDLIADKDDLCPDVPGVSEFNGCPDTDGDGIQDAEDNCPEEKGPKDNMGCPYPDSDGDGVVDKDDRCPEQAGTAANKGCPDSDRDGIVDIDDKCPNEAGPAANNGCPILDKDGDGVADADDRCPEQAGTAANKGCPDSDNDGVVDIDDKCPNEAGPASNNGCPELKEEEKKVVEVASRSIIFETGSTTLVSSSKNVLDQLSSILKTYPNKRVRISGYTDSVGREDSNQKLSENRAKACFEYLQSQGVAGSRMTYAGYGEANPIASNDTAEGRAENRRVVFEVID